MRYFIITLVLILVSLTSFGQVRHKGKQRAAWTFSMGPTVGLMDGTRFAPTTYGLSIQPRLIFGSLGRHSSASLAMPVMLNSFKQTYGIDSIITNGFTANIPIVVDFNFYHGAFKNTDNKIGFYLGAGWNFNYTSFSSSNREGVKDNYQGLNHGVYTNGGIRFGFPSGVSFDVKVYASLVFKTPELTIYGVAVLYNFGMKKRKGGIWFNAL